MLVNPCRDRLPLHLALIGMMGVALALSACGRKGGLDLPPSASIAEPAPAPASQSTSEATAGGWAADSRPVAPTGPDKRTPLDFLLD
jgi:predicted small lipoprotein YifL